MRPLHHFLLFVWGALLCFSLLPSACSAPTSIQRAELRRATINKNSYDEYKLDPVDLNDDETLFIVVEAFSGNPLLFVNYDNPATRDNYKWKPTGDQQIVGIQKKSDKYRVDVPFRIGVYGATKADYGLVAYTHRDRITLQEGIPLLGGVDASDYIFMEFQDKDNSSALEISLSSISGDPDVYVSTSPDPVRGNATWASREFGDGLIYIQTDDPDYVGNTKYYISVYGAYDSVFSISVTRDTQQVYHVLPSGVPHRGYVDKDEYIHYRFDLTGSHSLSIETTSFGGDVDLYVSNNGTASKDSYQWKSTKLGDDYIHIKTDDPHYVQDTYYIAVAAFIPGEYEIIAVTESDNVILEPGRPVHSGVARQEYTYFKFSHIDTQENIIITASASNGTVKIYGSSHLSQPNNETAPYESFPVGASEAVLCIPAAANSPGWYYFGVLGIEEQNTFDIIAKTNQTAEELELYHLSFFNTVPEGSYRYFFVDIEDATKDLTITVRSIDGDADLYVSNTYHRPTKDKYEWSSTLGTKDTATAFHDDPGFNSSTRFYIGVYGFSDASFSILAFQSSETLPLHEDEPVPGYVSKDRYVYYSFELLHPGGLVVELNVDGDEGDADIYASHSIKKPSKEHYDHKSTSFGDTVLEVDDAEQGMWYIAVFGVKNTSFDIEASSGYFTLDSKAILDQVESDMFRNYRLNVFKDTEAIVTSVTLVSGDTDLYLAFDSDGQNADRIHYNVSDHSFPGNVLLLYKDDYPEDQWASTWSLSVFGCKRSIYYISAAEAGTLQLRVPRLSLSSPIYTSYFVFTDTRQLSADLELQISNIEGEVHLYVSQETHQPDKNHNRWEQSGADELWLTMPLQDITSSPLFIGVESPKMLTEFVITLYEKGDPLLLVDSIPDRGNADKIDLSYYSALVSQIETEDLSVVVESCDNQSGPKFFGSFDEHKPNGLHHEFESHHMSSNKFVSTMTVPANSSEEFYVAVSGGSSGAEFSIVAYPGEVSQEPIPGNNGEMSGEYSDSVLSLNLTDSPSGYYPHHYAVYVMEVDANDDVPNLRTVCAVEEQGTWYISKQLEENEGSFVIDVEQLSNDKVYGINVVVSDSHFMKSVYTPIWLVEGSVQDNPDVHALSLGKPAAYSADSQSFKILKLPPVDLGSDDTLIFTVAALSGDPELYINYDDYPTQDDYVWSSTTATTEYQKITKSSNRYRVGKEFYVGIYGNTATDFVILAYIQSQDIQVIEGQPVLAVAPAGESTHFEWHLPSNSSFQVTGVPLEGDVDLYVDTQPHPDNKHCSWKSTEFGADFIQVLQDDEHFEPNANYYISGEAFAQETVFVLTVERISGDVIRTVADTVPQLGVVDGEEDLYYCFDLKHKGSLFIQLEVTESEGDADLFVSTKHKRPTSNNAQWKADNYGDDFIHIKTKDNNYKQGKYYITVHGVRSTTFRLTVFTEGDNVILTPGEPYDDTSDLQEYRYYKYYHDDPAANILLTTTAEKGTVAMYVSDTVTQPQNATGKYDFKSIAELNSEALVFIPAEDNEKTWYYIGVLGEDPYNKYTILAHTNQTATELIDGQVSSDHFVPKQHYRYFVFEGSAEPADVTISVHPAYGDADIYVSNTIARPSQKQKEHTWKADSYGTDTVIIEKDDPRREGHKFHIAVKGWLDTYFSIIAFQSGSALLLEDDVPTPGYVESGDYVYYRFNMPSQGTFLITLDVEHSYQDADLFVARHKKPNKNDKEYAATEYGSVSLRVEDAEKGDWYIGVLGRSDEHVSFSIRFTTQRLTLLMDADPVLDQTNQSEYRDYRFNVPDSIEEFSVSTVLINGITEMYLALGPDSEPTRHHNLLSNVSYPGNIIKVSKKEHPEVWDQECSLSVYGVDSSTYMISLLGPTPTVSFRQPHLSEVAPGDTAYFALVVPEINGNVPKSIDLYITLENKNALVDIYASQEEQKPDHNNYRWKSTNSNHHEIHIHKDSLVGGSLYVAVYGLKHEDSTPHRFVATALEEGDDMLLINGFYATLTTQKNAKQHFSTRLFSDRLYLLAESCDDRPAPSFSAESESHHDFQSIKDKQDPFSQFIIDSNAPKEETYSITVNGGKQGAKYQLYPTGHNYNRPNPGKEGRIAGVYRQNMLVLKLTDTYDTLFPHHFEVFVRNITDDTSANVHTSCSLRDKGEPSTTYTISSPNDDAAGGSFHMNVPGLSDKWVYGINVVATNGLHVERAYEPIYLVKGHVHSDPDKTALTRGQPFYDFVEQGEFDYFRLPAVDIDDDNPLYIVLTETSGNAALYINYDAKPTLKKSVWNTYNVTTDVVTIRKNDTKYQKGKDFYLGVYGESESDYNIVAYLSSDTISVIEAVPTTLLANPNEYTYFKWSLPEKPPNRLNVDDDDDDVDRASVGVASGSNKVPFYVHTEACNDEPLDRFFVGRKTIPHPTAKKHDFASESDPSGYTQELLTSAEANTDYYIGVQGTEHPFFSLVTSSEPSILPVAGNDGNLTGSYEDEVLTVNFTSPSGLLNAKQAHLYVYAREYYGSGDGSEININTVCALHDVATVVANGTFDVDVNGEHSVSVPSLSPHKIYGINVVVRSDNNAVSAAYKPIWLVNGHVQSDATNEHGGSNVGKILGGIFGTLGGLLLVGAAAGVVYYVLRRRRKGFAPLHDGQEEQHSDGHEHGNGQNVNTYGSIQD